MTYWHLSTSAGTQTDFFHLQHASVAHLLKKHTVNEKNVTVTKLPCWDVREREICARLRFEDSSLALLIFTIGMEKWAYAALGGV